MIVKRAITAAADRLILLSLRRADFYFAIDDSHEFYGLSRHGDIIIVCLKQSA